MAGTARWGLGDPAGELALLRTGEWSTAPGDLERLDGELVQPGRLGVTAAPRAVMGARADIGEDRGGEHAAPRWGVGEP